MKATTSLLLILCALATGASAAVPPRSEGGQTLQVSDDDLDLGQVYHALPDGETQIAVTAVNRYSRIVVTTSRTVGYIVAPFDPEESEKPLLKGAFRIPLHSVTTSAPSIDGMIRGDRLLDAAQHPEITFELTGVSDVEPVPDEDPDVTRYRLKLQGLLGAKGSEHEIESAAELALMLPNFRTFNRGYGDLAILKGDFEIDLAAMGFEPQRGRGELPKELSVSFHLGFSTSGPEWNFDPDRSAARWHGELRYLTLARDLGDAEAAAAHGRGYLKKAAGDAVALASLADLVLDTPGIEHRDLALAHEAARRAHEAAGGAEALARMARVCFAQGKAEEAVAWQKKAVAVEGLDEETAKGLKEDLERYSAAASP